MSTDKNLRSGREADDQGQRAADASGKSEDIVVFLTRQEGKCAGCDVELLNGSMIRLENNQPHCLDCADLGHLEFLSRGDAALTRRATKHSSLGAVVVHGRRPGSTTSGRACS